jgi:hypothetical protein
MLGDKEGLEDLMHVKSWDGLKQWVADHWDIVVEAAVKRLGKGVRSELEALRDMLDDDKIAREAIAPALLLMQAERLGVNETTLRYFAAVISGAIDGHGHVSAASKIVDLVSGEREIALLWAAALAAHGVEAEVRGAGGAYHVTASGDNAVKLAGLYFLYGPPLLEGDEKIINHKLAEAVELGAKGLSVSWEGLRRTPSGRVAADLIIQSADGAIKYNVYLRGDAIELMFASTDRSRAELAARLLKRTGVNAEVIKRGSKRVVWQVYASTDKLAAGHEELRKALAEIVEAARKSVGEEKAKRWLEKLKRGRVLMEGWPKFNVRLAKGALAIRFGSPRSDSIEQVAQWLETRGLKRGEHFAVKKPEGGKKGYVHVLKEGLAYAAWLSEHSENEEQRKLAAAFVEYILQRARDACRGAEPCAVYEKAKEIVEEGKAWRSQTLERFKKTVEVTLKLKDPDGTVKEVRKTYVVEVKGGGAEIEKRQGGKKLLRIKIKAEVGRVEGGHIVDRVESEYTITYGRYGADNEAIGYAYARANAPGGTEADAERYSALIKALTEREPNVYQRSDGKTAIICGREHLEGFMRYKELADTIKNWLEETSRR